MWIYLKIFPTCPRLSDWTSGLVLTEPPFTTFPACKKKETPILNCTQLYKIAKVKSKIKWNLTAFFFFLHWHPLSAQLLCSNSTLKTCLNITELSRDNSKVHWKENTDAYRVGMQFGEGTRSPADEEWGAAELPAGSKAQPWNRSAGRFSPHLCPAWAALALSPREVPVLPRGPSILLGTRNRAEIVSLSQPANQKAPVSTQICGVWAASKG